MEKKKYILDAEDIAAQIIDNDKVEFANNMLNVLLFSTEEPELEQALEFTVDLLFTGPEWDSRVVDVLSTEQSKFISEVLENINKLAIMVS